MLADINYRTHNGILAAAAGIVDLLERFFRNTIDSMARERGFFEGHRPILLSETAEHDAAVMILGSDRKHSQAHILSLSLSLSLSLTHTHTHTHTHTYIHTLLHVRRQHPCFTTSAHILFLSLSLSLSLSHTHTRTLLHVQIEFGAHQVLLMRNQASKHRLPTFFDGILATTILEAKGLEFDDVSPFLSPSIPFVSSSAFCAHARALAPSPPESSNPHKSLRFSSGTSSRTRKRSRSGGCCSTIWSSKMRAWTTA